MSVSTSNYNHVTNTWKTRAETQEVLKERYEGHEYRSGVWKTSCESCGEVFYSQHPAKYCRPSCKIIANTITRRMVQRQTRRNIICQSCGIFFDGKRKDTQYCSNKCRQKAYRNNMKIAKIVGNAKYSETHNFTNGVMDACCAHMTVVGNRNESEVK